MKRLLLHIALIASLGAQGCSESTFDHYPENLDEFFGPQADGTVEELSPFDATRGEVFLGLLDAAGAAAVPTEDEDAHSGPSDVIDALGPDGSDASASLDSTDGEVLIDADAETGDSEDADSPTDLDALNDADIGDEDSAVTDDGGGEESDALDGSTLADADTDEVEEDAEPDTTDTDAESDGDTDQGDTEDSEDATDADAATDSSDTEDTEDTIDAEPEPPEVPWLLSIDNGSDMLQKINTETGETTDVCQLSITSSYPSLTFSRDNKLFASRGGTALDIIDPCTCAVTPIGSYGGFSGVNGITSDQGIELFGVAVTQDDLIAISTSVGLATSVGDLGLNFGATGATWSDEDDTLYSIDASSDALYTIDPDTGAASFIAPVDMDFGTVGIELHPKNGVIYACSSAANLLSVNKFTGQVTVIGPMNQQEACTNLAAPYLPVACLEDI